MKGLTTHVLVAVSLVCSIACGTDDDGAGGTAGAGAGPSDDDGDGETVTTGSSTPVELEVSSFTVTASEVASNCPVCGQPQLVDCGDYEVSFTLTNTSSETVDDVRNVRFSVGDYIVGTDGELMPSEPFVCTQNPWRLTPGGSSEVRIHIGPGGSANQSCPVIDVPCGNGDLRIKWEKPIGNFVNAGTATIEAEGEAGDAGWFLSASTQIVPEAQP